MQLQGQSRKFGATVPVEMDEYNNVYVAQGGKHTEAALAGRLFYAANQSHVETGTTLDDTFKGLAIVNPADSGKIYIMHEFAYALMDSNDADTELSLVCGPTHSGFAADITVRCTRHGYRVSSAIADASATITGADGYKVKSIATLGTNATGDLLVGPTVVDLQGCIVLDPGRAVYTDTLLATADVMLFSFMWEEIDI